ncbi:hypothetical protein, partial [Paenibacillus macquariensis]|uniref:hypothetical protein n=1 Tax=Paenibacillus macquariensis TaxID=948756 RepID=UPI001BAEE5E2
SPWLLLKVNHIILLLPPIPSLRIRRAFAHYGQLFSIGQFLAAAEDKSHHAAAPTDPVPPDSQTI